MFAAFQKSLERPKLFKSISDLIQYRRQLIRHGPEWETIPILWDQAARIYSEKIVSLMMEKDPDGPVYPTISFMTVMNAADDVMRKRLSADFKLTVIILDMSAILFVTASLTLRRCSLIYIVVTCLQHMDGQISLKMLMMHLHQLVLRTSIEGIEKTQSALRRARLKLFLDQIHSQVSTSASATV
jgi:hypothetical protein